MSQQHSLHSREGSKLSEESMLGAEMLLNPDFMKKHEKKSDNGSDISIPLSKKSGKSDRSGKLSHRSEKSMGSKRFSDVYNNSQMFDEESSSSSPSHLLGSFRDGNSGSISLSKRSKNSKISRSSRSSLASSSTSSSASSRSSTSKSTDSSSSSVIVPKKKKMSQDDILKRKQELLFELDRFELKGRSYFRKLTLASSLEEIEGAHERIQLDMELDDAIASFRKLLISIVSICERVCDNYFFQKYSPIKPRLTGWSQSVSLEIESYDNVFKKLYIKHRSKTLVGPEIQLIGMIGMSAITFHITSLAANKFPGVSDMLNKDPSLFHKFVQFVNNPMHSAMNSMGQEIPSGGNYQNANNGMPNTNTNTNTNNGNNPFSGGGGGGGGGLSDLLSMGMSYLGSMMKPNIPSPQNGNNMPSPKMPMPNPPNQSPHQNKPQMPMPNVNQKPQMKGPSNVEDILKAIEENRLESTSNVSETEFSEIPDDVSINGAISKKPKRIVKN